ncbi:DUF697 domain-containing protein [Streptomyces aidingensis]|uniref:Uncharacterized conserved protein, DUF697 family n=1 Tax=Streptomyces aidingensis TaxID=910347 RepID=A0A1I1GR20_9ACTN|nr:DUF697 domain-containing protein [Streptomyces aidingensis]SFC14217.1 Uncharacterized conserved protein, DUF697 family [Streptomyces aidingensis]
MRQPGSSRRRDIISPAEAEQLLDPHHLLRDLAAFRAPDASAEAPPRRTETSGAAERTARKESRRAAQRAVLGTCGFSAAVGAVPLPFADAIPLTLAQVALVQKITEHYGHPPVAKDLTVLGSVLLAQGARRAGTYAAGSLVKLIPGAGSVAGAAVNASVATVGTAAVGYAWIGFCEYVATHEVGPLDEFLKTDIAKLLLAELNRRAVSWLTTSLIAEGRKGRRSGKEG